MNDDSKNNEDIKTFKYPLYLRIIFLVLIPITVAVFIILASATPRPYSLFDIVAGVVLLFVPIVAIYGFFCTGAKIKIKSDTIEFHPLIGRMRKIALSEIGGLEARHRLERLDIYDKDSNKVMHIYYALDEFDRILDFMSGKK